MARMPCSCSAADRLDIFDEKAARRALRRYLDERARRLRRGADRRVGRGGRARRHGPSSRSAAGSGRSRPTSCVAERPPAASSSSCPSTRAPRASSRAARASPTGRRSRSPTCSTEPDAVEPADIVVLRRVVCCTPDGPELLAAAAGKARRTLLASYPRDRLLVRLVFRLENLGLALFRKRFRSFVHRPAELERAVARARLRAIARRARPHLGDGAVRPERRRCRRCAAS